MSSSTLSDQYLQRFKTSHKLKFLDWFNCDSRASREAVNAFVYHAKQIDAPDSFNKLTLEHEKYLDKENNIEDTIRAIRTSDGNLDFDSESNCNFERTNNISTDCDRILHPLHQTVYL